MQKRLIDILADPDNPDIWPLKLKIFESEKRDRKSRPNPHKSSNRYCKFYCYTKNSYLVSDPLGEDEKILPSDDLDNIVTLDECIECMSLEITNGIIFHENENKLKWFIIDDEIPVMFPLELRDNDQEMRFINKYKKPCNEMGITSPYSVNK